MIVSSIEICKLKLPMVRSFATSFGVVDSKETVIVKFRTTDGRVGYGECSALSLPLYNAETIGSCMEVLTKMIAPAIVGKELSNIQEYLQALPFMHDVYTAKTGPECAFWHLLAQQDSISLSALFGGTRHEIPVGESIDIKNSLDELLSEISLRLDEGYRRIKLKIKPGWDIEPLRAVRDIWPDILLSADGNAGYKFTTHCELLQSLDQFNLAMLEQPLESHDFLDHATLQRNMRTPICLDESIRDVNDLRTADALGACKYVNMKPMRSGGVYECLQIYDFAAEHGESVWCGGALETGIGRAFNIALASKADCIFPADMSPYQVFFKEDLLESSFVVKPNGCVDVPTEPGLGYVVSDSQIEKFTVEKVVISTASI